MSAATKSGELKMLPLNVEQRGQSRAAFIHIPREKMCVGTRCLTCGDRVGWQLGAVYEPQCACDTTSHTTHYFLNDDDRTAWIIEAGFPE